MLHTLQRIEEHDAHQVKEQHGGGVCRPMLLLPWIDPADSVDQALDRAQGRIEPRPFALEHPRHVPAQRPDE
jgi:hypothetical protein